MNRKNMDYLDEWQEHGLWVKTSVELFSQGCPMMYVMCCFEATKQCWGQLDS